MINPKSRSLEWITEAARQIGVRDITLVEKTIRAFSLLEALTRSGCPFIFKGGSSLMHQSYWQFHSQRKVHLGFCHHQCSQSGLPQPTYGEGD